MGVRLDAKGGSFLWSRPGQRAVALGGGDWLPVRSRGGDRWSGWSG